MLEKRSVTIIRSHKVIGMISLRFFLLEPVNNKATSEKAEYMHTIMFATTKYLQCNTYREILIFFFLGGGGIEGIFMMKIMGTSNEIMKYSWLLITKIT
jgi:hypothetical protein